MNTILSAALPQRFAGRTTTTIALVAFGTVLITAFTQLRVPLPFTPVPITGQTFAVILWAIIAGRTVGTASVATYLMAGALGAPVFSGFASMTALWGPTSGYLLGFLPASFVAGWLSERKGLPTSAPLFATTMAGTALLCFAIIHAVGVLGLASFVGYDNVWAMGVRPFVLVDIAKAILIASVVTSLRRA